MRWVKKEKKLTPKAADQAYEDARQVIEAGRPIMTIKEVTKLYETATQLLKATTEGDENDYLQLVIKHPELDPDPGPKPTPFWKTEGKTTSNPKDHFKTDDSEIGASHGHNHSPSRNI